MPDAIVVGAGPNGLVAATRLADAGLEVLVLEAAARPGGSVKSAELVEPGFRHDVFSSFYPFAVVSPALAELGLDIRWRRAPLVLAHPAPDGSCAVLSRDLDETLASIGEDAEPWRKLVLLWRRVGPALVEALVTPLPAHGSPRGRRRRSPSSRGRRGRSCADSAATRRRGSSQAT